MGISQNQCDLAPAASVNSDFHSADCYSVHNWQLFHASILLGGGGKDSIFATKQLVFHCFYLNEKLLSEILWNFRNLFYLKSTNSW